MGSFDCPLCGNESEPRLSAPLGRFVRAFFHCPGCDLLWTPDRPPADEERSRYAAHENDPRDPAYRNFLSPVLEAVTTRMPPGARGLDYGCGPTQALAAWLREGGYRMEVYDPFFYPGLPGGLFDFITCTEAAEHFHAPGREFARLREKLAPGGILVVMTQFRRSWETFPGWHYHRDPTHVCFYSKATLGWIGRRLGLGASFTDPGLAVFSAPPARDSRPPLRGEGATP